jgi:hypothetical protein
MIKCRANLKKDILDDDDACPICTAESETMTHLMLACPVANQFWNRIGVDVDHLCRQKNDLGHMQLPMSIVNHLHSDTLLHLVCWMLWKQGNK